MRLIDADALGIGKANPEAFIKPEYAYGWNSAIEAIEAAPTIDAVPVDKIQFTDLYLDGSEAIAVFKFGNQGITLRKKYDELAPVVHGRWEIKWNAEFVDPFGETEEIPSAVCPFCGHEEFYVAYDDDWAKPHNYCSNCGAKLDGEADG